MSKSKGISVEEVRRIAQLAHLDVSAAEESRYAAELSEILDYVSLLQKVDLSAVDPYFKARGQKLEARDDKAEYFYARRDLVDGKHFKDNLLVTPAIFDHESANDHQGDPAGPQE